MAYIHSRVSGNISSANLRTLREQVGNLEQELGVPIRVVQSLRARTINTLMNDWTGDAAVLTNYPDGTTAEDLRERGLTISFFQACTDIPGTAQDYDYGQFFNDDFFDGDTGHETARRYQYEHMVYGGPRNGDANLPDAVGEHALALPHGLHEQDGGPGGAGGNMGENAICVGFDNRLVLWGITPYSLSRYGPINWEYLLCFDYFREGADPEARAAALARRQAAQERWFYEAIRDRGNDPVTTLRQEIAEHAEQLAEAQATIVNHKESAKQKQRQLDILLEADGDMTAEEAAREYRLIMQNEKVEDITTSGSGNDKIMTVHTVALDITDPTSRRTVPLGKFAIKLDFRNNMVHVHNKTMRQADMWDHPHVRHGRLCARDYQTTITEKLRRRELSGMVGMLFHILRTVTAGDDWARSIQYWLQAEDQRIAELEQRYADTREANPAVAYIHGWEDNERIEELATDDGEWTVLD
jgi:hypothetical protein